jgi:hypothetical protein
VVLETLPKLGVDDEDVTGLQRILAAVIHMCEVDFKVLTEYFVLEYPTEISYCSEYFVLGCPY